MSKRKPWYVKVGGLNKLPPDKRKLAMKQIMDTCREWYEKGPDPLVLPDSMDISYFEDEWDHEVIELLLLHPDDVTRLIRDYERDGWQVATSIDRPGAAPLLIFKRPKPVADLRQAPDIISNVFGKEGEQ